MENLQDPSIKPLSRNDMVGEQIDQELFLYDESSGVVHSLNGGAAMVWFLCDGTRNAANIADEIADTFSLENQEVLADVREALAKFQELDMLES